MRKIITNVKKYFTVIDPNPKIKYLRNLYVLSPISTIYQWKEFEKIHSATLTIHYVSDENKIIELLTNGLMELGSIVIVDDMTAKFENKKLNSAIIALFTELTHHRYLWTFLMTHDYFSGKSTTIRRNTQNTIIFKNVADEKSFHGVISTMVGLDKVAIFDAAYRHSIQKPYGFVCLSVRRPSNHRVLYGGLDGPLFELSGGGDAALSPYLFEQRHERIKSQSGDNSIESDESDRVPQ